MKTQPLIFIVGVTASGKSALGLELAEAFSGAILNCDSLQVYQRLDIGTAKPTPEERARRPHFLFDFVPPGEVLTAGDFRRAALERLQADWPRGPIFAVGGSGFYVQALEKGMFDVPKPSPAVEATTRARVAQQGWVKTYEELTARDPETAERLNPNDRYRIVRALVLMDESGTKASTVRASFKPQPLPYPVLKLGVRIEKSQLLARVQARTARMLGAGLVAETEALVNEGFAAWAPLSSVGYKECQQVLRGELARSALPEKITEKTMQLAKKQRTWFQRDEEITWVDEPAQAEGLVRAFIDRFR